MHKSKQIIISADLKNELLQYQRNEITEHYFYQRLIKNISSEKNRQVLMKISMQELQHYHTWRKYTGIDIGPDRYKLWKYLILARLFGFTFTIKFMELSEQAAQRRYTVLCDSIPEARSIIDDERCHESELIELLDERRLRYLGSIVLGLNDALIELTGVLAGLTLALQNTNLIALVGLITGITAAMSMGASEYLAKKSEESGKNPLRAAFYTGITYLFTVGLLVLPFLVIENYLVALPLSLTAAILIIGVFNYYIAVAKEVSFKKRFLGMAGLSLGVSTLSFLLGLGIRTLLGVEI